MAEDLLHALRVGLGKRLILCKHADDSLLTEGRAV